MAHTSASRAFGQPSIQDPFLTHARRERLPVVVQMMTGERMEGRIRNFDRFAVLLEHDGADHMVFKHAIATIRTPRSATSAYSQT